MSTVKVNELPKEFQNGYLVNLRIRKWGATTKADESTLPDDFPKEIYKAVQDLLDSEGRELLDGLNTIKGQAHKVINENSIYHPIPGFRFLKENQSETRLQNVYDRIEEIKKQYFNAAQNFIQCFEDLKRKYKAKFPKDYREDKYPTAEQIQKTFKFELQIFEFKTPPETLQKISPAVYDQQMDEIKSNIKEMGDYVLKVVANELVERMSVLQEQCNGGKINSRTLSSINDLISKFDDLYGDFTDNKKIKEYISDMKEYMDGTDADMLRSSDDFRTMVADKAKEIVQGIQNIPAVKGKLKRSFDF